MESHELPICCSWRRETLTNSLFVTVQTLLYSLSQTCEGLEIRNSGVRFDIASIQYSNQQTLDFLLMCYTVINRLVIAPLFEDLRAKRRVSRQLGMSLERCLSGEQTPCVSRFSGTLSISTTHGHVSHRDVPERFRNKSTL